MTILWYLRTWARRSPPPFPVRAWSACVKAATTSSGPTRCLSTGSSSNSWSLLRSHHLEPMTSSGRRRSRTDDVMWTGLELAFCGDRGPRERRAEQAASADRSSRCSHRPPSADVMRTENRPQRPGYAYDSRGQRREWERPSFYSQNSSAAARVVRQAGAARKAAAARFRGFELLLEGWRAAGDLSATVQYACRAWSDHTGAVAASTGLSEKWLPE